jgi:hypothetical protein
LSKVNKIKNHVLYVREVYLNHIAKVNLLSKEKFEGKHITYKKSTGELDMNDNLLYDFIEARIEDVTVTSDHDLMFDVIDVNDNRDIIFSFNIIELKD